MRHSFGVPSDSGKTSSKEKSVTGDYLQDCGGRVGRQYRLVLLSKDAEP